MVNSRTAVRASLYREKGLDFQLGVESREKSPNKFNFLVLYQTDFEESLKSKEYLEGRVRQSSELWADNRTAIEVGDFDIRNYALMQNPDDGIREEGGYFPRGSKQCLWCHCMTVDWRFLQAPSPVLLTVEMDPLEAADAGFDSDGWYRESHLNMLHRMPGHRRSLTYMLGPKTMLTLGRPPKYLAMYGMDHLQDLDNDKGTKTAWTRSDKTRVFIPRQWELIHSRGFPADC